MKQKFIVLPPLLIIIFRGFYHFIVGLIAVIGIAALIGAALLVKKFLLPIKNPVSIKRSYEPKHI